ncbi:MAG: glycosyltransferase family 4 protein [Actinomycetota bacterium]|nr:glycosyltransferase family 4 protein [Actinomycetota bacterium]
MDDQRPRPAVLWITEEPPDRSLGGGNIRQAHLLLGLARRADVTLLVMGTLGDEGVRDACAEVIDLPGVRLPAPRSTTARRLFDLWIAARGPREVVLTTRPRRVMAPIVGRLEDRFDLVVASHLGMAALRPARPAAPWVAQLHHVTSARGRQERDVTPGRRQRWLLDRDAAHAARFEARLLEQFDGVVVVSPEDAALLGAERASGRVLVAPNGVDVEHYRPSPIPPEPSIVMTGSLQYGPNVDGAVWFCDEVLPLVRAQVPAATLTLVGREPRDEVRALASREGVALHADVPDMAPWLAAARVTVVPLRIGTGTRLKALESMAAGRPVVGTTIGLEGLDVEAGRHAEVADDAPAMAAALIRLLRDDEHASALAAAGRALVEERFRWGAIADQLADELLGLVP